MPLDDADFEELLEDAVQAPASVTVDGRTTQSRPLPDMIEFDKYRRSKAAGRSTTAGIRIGKFKHPGAAE